MRETVDGRATLWWFAADGSVAAHRVADVLIRRSDEVGLDDLPARPASYPITLPANVHLPRIFTARSLDVDIVVQTDETVRPPRIPENPFTKVLAEEPGRVRVRCLSHDDPGATTRLPIAREEFAEYLRPTPLMECTDPRVVDRAKTIVAGETDARKAAARIADFVFHYLDKESPDIPEPSATQILRERRGDCSEHALLFTTLCRAAGIPARRCSGWVCIGDDWGGHAWCEIWVGRWIGADPTTNEIGTYARYIFLSRPDDRSVRPGVLHPRRTRLLIRRAAFGDGVIDFESPEAPDEALLSGLRLGPLPNGWTARYQRGVLALKSPTFLAYARIQPDHGYRDERTIGRGFQKTRFGGRVAFHDSGYWRIPLGRELLELRLLGEGADPEAVAELLKPTLTREE